MEPSSSLIVKFADDTTVSGLIRSNDETVYRNQVKELESWCAGNSLQLNVSKTTEIIIDFRTLKKSNIEPLLIDGMAVEQVESFKFLGTHISNSLNWSVHINSNIKKAQQRMYFLRRLKSFHVDIRILTNFYKCVIESILTYSIIIWYNAT